MRCSPRHQVPRSRPAGHRRGAAFRRQAQGAAEGDARQRACADADRDAYPAHPAAGAVGRARAVAHHHAAARPAGGAHLHLALRSRHHPRVAACANIIAAARASMCARAFPTSTSIAEFLAQLRARGEVPHRPRPHGADRARRHHVRVSTTASSTCCCRPPSSNPASIFRPPTR